MKDYYPDDPLTTLAAIIVGSTIALAVMFSCIGCATTKCPPCVPEIEFVQVSVPVPSCPSPEVLPMLDYPEWPTLVQGASEGQIKAFYAQCVATLNAREKIMLERIKSLEEILEGYR